MGAVPRDNFFDGADWYQTNHLVDPDLPYGISRPPARRRPRLTALATTPNTRELGPAGLKINTRAAAAAAPRVP